MTDEGRIVAIVPAYNEAGAIGDVVDSIRAASAAYDVVVIDDRPVSRSRIVTGTSARRSRCLKTSTVASTSG